MRAGGLSNCESNGGSQSVRAGGLSNCESNWGIGFFMRENFFKEYAFNFEIVEKYACCEYACR